MERSNKALLITGIVILIALAVLTRGFGLIGLVISTQALEIGESPVLGDANAPITIYEFTDFSCPYCAAAVGENENVINYFKGKDSNWQAPIPNIIKDYVETGKVKIVFKYYPGHGTGMAAQTVGYALQEQGLFWQFEQEAFANQAMVSDLAKMEIIAIQLGADIVKINEFIASGKATELANKDIKMAKSNGVTGTPVFFINGREIKGAQSYSAFKKIIDEELAKI